jgi:uncharacterized protein YukE
VTDPLGASPSELRATADYLAKASARLKQVMMHLNTNICAEGEDPWGGDDYGDHFAKGPQGYLAQAAGVQDGVDAKTGLLDKYSADLRKAADGFEQLDQA